MVSIFLFIASGEADIPGQGETGVKEKNRVMGKPPHPRAY